MQIDGDQVATGDQVWHDRYGFGTVLSVTSGTCDVRFNASDRHLTFTDGGNQNGRKVLFWSEPMIFTPRKNVDYTKFKKVVQSILDMMYGD